MIGGRLKFFYEFWKTLTSDSFILETIQGAKLKFLSMPIQSKIPCEIQCSAFLKIRISKEVQEYLRCGIISMVEHCEFEFISQIFPREKKDGSLRIILNLSELNLYIQYEHFKMEGLNTIFSLVGKGCFMACIDLKQAYFSVNLDPSSRKFLRFQWNGKLFEFNCLPNGFSAAPRMFTKIMKPIFASLRNQGFLSVYYIDDIWLMGETYEACKQNVNVTLETLSKAGFIINSKKSILAPVQNIQVLGMIIDSVEMSVSLPQSKTQKILTLCNKILESKIIKIRDLAKLVGVLVASLPAVQHGALFYRFLEANRNEALKISKGDFDDFTTLTEESKSEISWWLSKVQQAKKMILVEPPSAILTTDASEAGWGAVYEGKTTGGRWSYAECSNHINVLELRAIFFGLKSFFNLSGKCHVRIKCDNSTAVCYINNLGGVKSMECHKVTRDIWQWAIERNIHLSAEHLPGSKNVTADKASRIFDENTEWQISGNIFNKIIENFGSVDIDLFASRLNAKHEVYASWKPDPFAKFIDAFAANWKNLKFYAFPPFSVVLPCLRKVQVEGATGILVVPLWPTQAWFPKLIQMLIDVPLILPLNSISLPFNKSAEHKQKKTLRLMACHISGVSSKTEVFLKSPLISCVRLGEIPPLNSTKFILENGVISVRNKKLIPCHVMNRW